MSFNALGTFSTTEMNLVWVRKSIVFLQNSEAFLTFSKIVYHMFINKVPLCFHWRVLLINQCQGVACGFCK